MVRDRSACRDACQSKNLGSIIAVVNAAGGKVFEAEYDAWGNQTVTRNDIRLSRGYTGHKMLRAFGLIHMDGRVYDPVIGRFLSPDNYVQLPENSQSFNRYSYCLNNPLKYVDPDGEFPWLLIAVAGAINVAANWDGGSGFWYHMGSFVVGASAAALGTCTGGLAIAGSGALLGVGNYANGQWTNGGCITIGGLVKSAGFGAATAALGAELGSLIKPLTDKIGVGISSRIVSRAVSNAVGGAAVGTVTGALFSINDKNTSFWKGAWKGLRDGAVYGAITGAAQGYYEFQQERAAMRLQNALNGDLERSKANFGNDKTAAIKSAVNDFMKNENFPQGNGTNSVYVGVDESETIRYVGITQREPEIRFSEHLNSGTARSTLHYYTIDGTGQLSRIQARIIEQQLINKFGFYRYKGSLFNKINSISPRKWGRYGIK